jgi:alpha-glucosidase (family GH31 glycosyl hydrolase)
MCLHYGYDSAVWGLGEQYLVGTELLAAPVLYEGASAVDVYFPRLSGSWVHIVSTAGIVMLGLLSCSSNEI